MNRRHFLGAGVAGLSTLLLSPGGVFAQSDLGAPALPSPGFRKAMVGKMEIFALNDGIGRRPLVDGFVRNASLDDVKALLGSQNLPTNYIDIPFTPFVVADGDTHYLIDTGFADNGPPSAGKLQANMAAAGLKPEDIDHVIISHFHGDHINGLRYKNGDLVYPKAKVHVCAPEYAFWTDAERRAKAPEGMKGAFAAVERALGTLPADQLVKFEPDAQVAPGIRSLAAFGHTPGHTAFMVESDGQKFVYAADTTNMPALFVRRPDWAVMFDMDPDMARASRKKVLDMVSSEDILTGGFHFPFPAMGKITREGEGYLFTPMA